LSPSKYLHTLLAAVRRVIDAGAPAFRVGIVGGPAVPSDDEYIEGLRAQRDELGLEDVVVFHGAVPFAELPAWYQRASVFVNLSETGTGDKVALEAMATGVPTLAANVGFKETHGAHADVLLYPLGDDEALADRLGALLRMEPSQRAAIGADLRAAVMELHAIDGLADRLVALFVELQAGRRRGPGPVKAGP
jgi:phosphatidylinositol alpha-1,6-mannosyltransferase